MLLEKAIFARMPSAISYVGLLDLLGIRSTNHPVSVASSGLPRVESTKL